MKNGTSSMTGHSTASENDKNWKSHLVTIRVAAIKTLRCQRRHMKRTSVLGEVNKTLN